MGRTSAEGRDDQVVQALSPACGAAAGLFDLLLLVSGGEMAWHLRAGHIGMDPGSMVERLWPQAGFAVMLLAAMISVGDYDPDSLRSTSFACVELLVAVSLGIIALSFIDFLLDAHTFWRSMSFVGPLLDPLTTPDTLSAVLWHEGAR